MVSSVVMAMRRGYDNEDKMQKQMARMTATSGQTEGEAMKEQKTHMRFKRIGMQRKAMKKTERSWDCIQKAP